LSYSNDIKNLMDIQDTNIIIEENAVQIKQYRGSTSKFIQGKLTYTPTHCESCGIK